MRSVAAALCLGASLLLWALPVAAQQPDPEEMPGAPTVAEAEAMEARLQAAIQVNPAVASLRANLGELYRSQARLSEARDAYTEAVRIEPMNAAYRQALARTHLALDEFAAAEVNFAWGAELSPQDPAMYTGLGEALIGQGKTAEARTAIRRAAEFEPQSAEVERLLALARSSGGRDEGGTGESLSAGQVVGRVLTYLFAASLAVAGIGLALPLAAALGVLVVLLPRAVLERRRS